MKASLASSQKRGKSAPASGRKTHSEGKESNAMRRDSTSIQFEAHQGRKARYLEMCRDKATARLDYKEAGRLHKELETMINAHNYRQGQKFQIKQMQDTLDLFNEQQVELRDFEEEWKEKLSDFGKQVEMLREGFTKEQGELKKQHLEEDMKKHPALTLKPSKQLNFMRNQAKQLAKLQRFEEAHKVHEEAKELAKKEQGDFQAKLDHMSLKGGVSQFVHEQEFAKDIFKTKIDAQDLTLKIQKRVLLEEILKKHRIQRARLKAKQTREKYTPPALCPDYL